MRPPTPIHSTTRRRPLFQALFSSRRSAGYVDESACRRDGALLPHVQTPQTADNTLAPRSGGLGTGPKADEGKRAVQANQSLSNMTGKAEETPPRFIHA